jgi:hypothetical protein
MPQDINIDEKQTAEAPKTSEDLSKAIEKSVERQPDEQVKSVRLFDNFYRCNWWVEDKTPHPFWISTGKIRKSSFLRATMTPTGLHIEDVGERR